MAKLSKTKKQLIMLGGLVALILGVIIWMSVGSGSGDQALEDVYTTKTVTKDISLDIFESPEYKKLQSPISLPLTPGSAGRDNPFAKF